jgi:AraC family transcriptional regulator
MLRSPTLPAFPVTVGEVLGSRRIGQLTITESTHGAALTIPRHTHETAGLTIVLAGRFVEEFAASSHDCVRGSALLKPAGEPHANRYGPAGARSLLVQFSPAFVDSLRDGGCRLDAESFVAPAVVGGLARRAAREFHDATPAARVALEGILLELTALGLRARDARAPRGSPPPVRRAIDYLHGHVDRTVPLARLGQVAETHPLVLVRLFRASLGTTPSAYARQLKLDHARRLIAETDLPLALVAMRAGFADQSHLTRRFVVAFGLSPGKYRRLMNTTVAFPTQDSALDTEN